MPVIRDKDDERFFPKRRLFQAIDKFSKRIVRIGNGAQHAAVAFFAGKRRRLKIFRDIKRLVIGQRQ